MGRRGVRVVVLCEDKQQYSFALRCLKRLGFGFRDVEEKFTALGREGGAGEKFVRDRYGIEAAAIRRRHAAGALLVVIDADTETVRTRERQLAKVLATTDPTRRVRKDGEPIAHWIPRRNIETWIHFLLGEPVSETAKKPYAKFTGHESECQRRIISWPSRMARPKCHRMHPSRSATD